jgi:hypothetical protein
MNDNAEKWEAASSELRSAFYARMAEVEKTGISYVLLKHQKKLLDKQADENGYAMVFYFVIFGIGTFIVAIWEYLVLHNISGYFIIMLLLWVFNWEILKARTDHNYVEAKRVEWELARIRVNTEISSFLLSKMHLRGFDKYFENRLFGEYEDLEQYESYMIPERKRLESEVFLSLIERKSNPFL